MERITPNLTKVRDLISVPGWTSNFRRILAVYSSTLLLMMLEDIWFPSLFHALQVIVVIRGSQFSLDGNQRPIFPSWNVWIKKGKVSTKIISTGIYPLWSSGGDTSGNTPSLRSSSLSEELRLHYLPDCICLYLLTRTAPPPRLKFNRVLEISFLPRASRKTFPAVVRPLHYFP